MSMTLAEVAALIDGRLTARCDVEVLRAAPLANAGPDEICFLTDPVMGAQVNGTSAAAVVVPDGFPDSSTPLIHVASPEKAMVTVLRALSPPIAPAQSEIHPFAEVAPSATIGANVSIGPNATIGARAIIADDVCIGPAVSVGDDVSIGPDTWVYSGVRIYSSVTLGSGVIIHSGVVLGSDGFGYIQDGQDIVKIPQTGSVVIGDDVEIGANTTIDCGTLGATSIGSGTKIDNQVQIGHNVTIGKHVRICAQVGIAGSTAVEDGVIIAGQAGLMDHISVGSYARIGGQAGVTKSVPPGVAVSGYPARPHGAARKIEAYINRLPELARQIKQQQQLIDQLTALLKEKE